MCIYCDLPSCYIEKVGVSANDLVDGTISVLRVNNLKVSVDFRSEFVGYKKQVVGI
jgi:hypothetical protein